MWKGYEPYLLTVYLRAIMDEWIARGYNNTKCEIHYNRLYSVLGGKRVVVPSWFSEDFFNSHKSNLLRKNYEYYHKYWPNIPIGLEYIWPKNI
jgi:hypothetical protein